MWTRSFPLQNDLIAGVSVGFMVVPQVREGAHEAMLASREDQPSAPQGMAYASSAGLPSVYGLYGAFLPCLVYCLVGSSRQLAVGPVAVTSLLLAANLHDLVPCRWGMGGISSKLESRIPTGKAQNG